jgi:hypothetical protein
MMKIIHTHRERGINTAIIMRTLYWLVHALRGWDGVFRGPFNVGWGI